MSRLFLFLFLFLLLHSASGQSLSVRDLSRLYHYGPNELLSFMKQRGWDGNTQSVRDHSFEMSWQRNLCEDIVVRQDSGQARLISYRLHSKKDIDAFCSSDANLAGFDSLPSNVPSVKLLRNKYALQSWSLNSTRGILTVRYEEHVEAGFWTELLDKNSAQDRYAVGSFLASEGGVVIGLSPDGSEAYVVALRDQNIGAGCSWSSVPTLVEGCFLGRAWNVAHSDFNGPANTRAIISHVSSSGQKQKRAAQLCAEYNGGGHSDWYLPSIPQLKMMADNKVDIDASLRKNGGSSISSMWYWSSSQFNESMVWSINFKTLILGQSAKDGHDRVRAVRSIRVLR